MSNHPDLYDKYGENFALLEFSVSEFGALSEKIVAYLSQEHETPPTAAELQRAMRAPEDSPFAYKERGLSLDEFLSQVSYIGPAKAAHPDAPLKEADEAWQANLASIEQEKIDAERLQRSKDAWTN
jgi:hypothetical protein